MQHLPDHRTTNDTVLQRVAADQKWRVKRTETVHADGGPRLAAGRAEVRLPRLDVADQPGLKVDLMKPPAAFDVDPHRPIGQALHLSREPVEFPGGADEVGQ